LWCGRCCVAASPFPGADVPVAWRRAGELPFVHGASGAPQAMRGYRCGPHRAGHFGTPVGDGVAIDASDVRCACNTSVRQVQVKNALASTLASEINWDPSGAAFEQCVGCLPERGCSSGWRQCSQACPAEHRAARSVRNRRYGGVAPSGNCSGCAAASLRACFRVSRWSASPASIGVYLHHFATSCGDFPDDFPHGVPKEPGGPTLKPGAFLPIRAVAMVVRL
jgi:hypothetical protein